MRLGCPGVAGNGKPGEDLEQEGAGLDLGLGEGAAGSRAKPSRLCLSSIIYTQEGKLPCSLGPPADKTHKDKRLGALECVCWGEAGQGTYPETWEPSWGQGPRAPPAL